MAGIVAAHETTANASANAIKLLLQHPDAWREICADPALIPNAVEECLRHNGSVAAWRRLVTRDAQVGGIAPAGRQQAADRHLVRQSRRTAFRRCGPVRHPPGQCQRPADLRLRLAPVHGQEPRAHGDAGLPGGADAPAAPSAAGRAGRSATCRTPRSGARSISGSNGTRRAIPSAPIRPAAGLARRRCGLASPPRTPSPAPWWWSASTPVADNVVRLRLVAPDGKALPRWAPGAHIDVECGHAGMSRQYSLCGDPADARRLRDRRAA